MRILNWNIEWMNNWFEGNRKVAFKNAHTHGDGKIDDVDGLCTRVASVITNLNPDVLTVQEGPSDHREMALFVKNYLVTTSRFMELVGAIQTILQRLLDGHRKSTSS